MLRHRSPLQQSLPFPVCVPHCVDHCCHHLLCSVHFQEQQHLETIEFQPTIPLVIHQVVQGTLDWLDNWLGLGHYMKYLQNQAQNMA